MCTYTFVFFEAVLLVVFSLHLTADSIFCPGTAALTATTALISRRRLIHGPLLRERLEALEYGPVPSAAAKVALLCTHR